MLSSWNDVVYAAGNIKYPRTYFVISGTNDLRHDNSTVDIGKKIIEVAVSCKLAKNNVLMSGIFPRREKLNWKAIFIYKMNIIKKK